MSLIRNLIASIILIMACQHILYAKPPVYLIISVDWEGDLLKPVNLQAMRQFSKRFPQIPLVQFLNAAYFLKTSANRTVIAKKIKSVLRPGDQIGLHIHSWKSLIEASGVKYKPSPTFWGLSISKGRHGDPGDDVPLTEYSRAEVSKIIKFSLDTLQEHKLGPATAFRGGGWMVNDDVFRAMQENGIFIDSSAVPAHLIAHRYPNTKLLEMAQKTWPGVNELTLPYLHKIDGQQPLFQFPNNQGLAGYNTQPRILHNLKNMIESSRTTEQPVVLHYGFHQENISEFLQETIEIVANIFRYTQSQGLEVIPITLDALKATLVQQGFFNNPPKPTTCRRLARSFNP